MVTGLRISEPPKKDRTPISPELAKMINAARSAALKRKRPAPKFPIAVAKFLGKGVAREIQVITCIRICAVWMCITCCFGDGLPTNGLCGHVTIDTTVYD